jgi:thiol-disulfide isomerase/thioredoxin
MSPGLWVLLIAVGGALAFGCWRLATDGRFRGTHRVRGAGADLETVTESVLAGTLWQDRLGERVTLLQFSSAFCAPCRAARRTLSSVAEELPGVAHLEIDAEQHLDLVRRLGVLRTPTTLILDHDGSELTRATGAPTREQVLSALS